MIIKMVAEDEFQQFKEELLSKGHMIILPNLDNVGEECLLKNDRWLRICLNKDEQTACGVSRLDTYFNISFKGSVHGLRASATAKYKSTSYHLVNRGATAFAVNFYLKTVDGVCSCKITTNKDLIRYETSIGPHSVQGCVIAEYELNKEDTAALLQPPNR